VVGRASPSPGISPGKWNFRTTLAVPVTSEKSLCGPWMDRSRKVPHEGTASLPGLLVFSSTCCQWAPSNLLSSH
jgi:hypothetical protein